MSNSNEEERHASEGGWTGKVRRGMHVRAELLRFGAVGVANTAIDFVVFLILSAFGLPILLSNFISTSCGMVFSFFANGAFTFRKTRRSRPIVQALMFFLVTGTSVWAIQPAVILLVQGPISTVVGSLTVLALAKLAGIIVGFVWNYILDKYLVYR